MDCAKKKIFSANTIRKRGLCMSIQKPDGCRVVAAPEIGAVQLQASVPPGR